MAKYELEVVKSEKFENQLISYHVEIKASKES